MISENSKVKVVETGEVGVVIAVNSYSGSSYATIVLDEEFRDGNRWHDWFQIKMDRLESIE